MFPLPEIETFDLDAYCARIGYLGERSPTLATLREIQWRHISSIPFENLACLAGEPVPLDLAALQAKMIRSPRGGYCFEHNILFAAALQRLGFAVTGLAARVLWKAPPDRSGPRTHMLLRVDLVEGTYIADTGFGGVSMPGPLELVTGRIQATPIERYRLTAQRDLFHLDVELRGEWQPVYSFDLQPQQYVDYEVANWFVSTHPTSRFTQVLLVARPAGQRRQSLFERDLSLHEPDGRRERRQLASVEELRQTLAGLFGIEVPPGAPFDAALARILASP
ncbi:MAG: arylamine N-acetyltransferase [Gammaproteobacteria bacterium]|nr:arylamine N-acetyltransferase [Gammaproteobacteria bacterium]